MKEMVGGCCVCSDERGWDENPLVYCDGPKCNVAVHQACYGIEAVPSGNWYCRKCETHDRSSPLQCELCPSKEGAFKKTDQNTWAHVVCALYIPEVRFGNVATMEPIIISHIPTERFHRSCYLCEEREGKGSSRVSAGAFMNCNKSGCRTNFHVTCAQYEGNLCEESGTLADNVKYCGYCKYHWAKIKKTSNMKIIPPYKPIISPTSSPEKSKPTPLPGADPPISTPSSTPTPPPDLSLSPSPHLNSPDINNSSPPPPPLHVPKNTKGGGRKISSGSSGGGSASKNNTGSSSSKNNIGSSGSSSSVKNSTHSKKETGSSSGSGSKNNAGSGSSGSKNNNGSSGSSTKNNGSSGSSSSSTTAKNAKSGSGSSNNAPHAKSISGSNANSNSSSSNNKNSSSSGTMNLSTSCTVNLSSSLNLSSANGRGLYAESGGVNAQTKEMSKYERSLYSGSNESGLNVVGSGSKESKYERSVNGGERGSNYSASSGHKTDFATVSMKEVVTAALDKPLSSTGSKYDRMSGLSDCFSKIENGPDIKPHVTLTPIPMGSPSIHETEGGTKLYFSASKMEQDRDSPPNLTPLKRKRLPGRGLNESDTDSLDEELSELGGALTEPPPLSREKTPPSSRHHRDFRSESNSQNSTSFSSEHMSRRELSFPSSFPSSFPPQRGGGGVSRNEESFWPEHVSQGPTGGGEREGSVPIGGGGGGGYGPIGGGGVEHGPMGGGGEIGPIGGAGGGEHGPMGVGEREGSVPIGGGVGGGGGGYGSIPRKRGPGRPPVSKGYGGEEKRTRRRGGGAMGSISAPSSFTRRENGTNGGILDEDESSGKNPPRKPAPKHSYDESPTPTLSQLKAQAAENNGSEGSSANLAPHMFGNVLNPASSMAQRMVDSLSEEMESMAAAGNGATVLHSGTNSPLVGIPLPGKTKISTTTSNTSNVSNVSNVTNCNNATSNTTTTSSNSGSGSANGGQRENGGGGSNSKNYPQTLEELLERQWEQGSQFLMEQAQHLDISQLLSCLNQLKQDNRALEEHVASLCTRKEQLTAINARLSIPLSASNSLASQLGIMNNSSNNNSSGTRPSSPPPPPHHPSSQHGHHGSSQLAHGPSHASSQHPQITHGTSHPPHGSSQQQQQQLQIKGSGMEGGGHLGAMYGQGHSKGGSGSSQNLNSNSMYHSYHTPR